MTRMSSWPLLLLSLALTTALVYACHDTGAQQKKEEKKLEKKAETKKIEKKEEVKEEKKPPFEPDRPEAELKGHTDWINAIEYSADGKTLASASRDRTVRLWDVLAKKDLRTFKGNPSNLKGLVYQRDTIYASTGKFNKEKKSWQGEIKRWDAKSGKEAPALHGHAEEIECLAITKDGKLLASGSDDQTAKIWELAAAKDVQTLKGHTGAIHSVAFSADGKKVATASADGTVKLWEPLTGKELTTFKVSEKKIKVKDAKGKESDAIEKGRPFAVVAFSPNGKRLAAGTLDGLIKLYDLDAQKEVQELKAHDGIWALAFSPDGTKLASGGWDQTIKIWDAATGKDVQTIKAHLGTVTTIAFSPTSPQLASGGLDGLIKIWALAPGKK
jgi:WD40 repeat protein